MLPGQYTQAVHAGNDVVQLAKDFKLTAGIHRVLVVSYETIRKIADELAGCCDVLVMRALMIADC